MVYLFRLADVGRYEPVGANEVLHVLLVVLGAMSWRVRFVESGEG